MPLETEAYLFVVSSNRFAVICSGLQRFVYKQ